MPAETTVAMPAETTVAMPAETTVAMPAAEMPAETAAAEAVGDSKRLRRLFVSERSESAHV
jgi:hypothetical protein